MKLLKFKSIAIISGAVLLLLTGGCGTGELKEPDDFFSEPIVVDTLPPDGSLNAAVDGNVVASFNKAMNPLTINTDSFIIVGPGLAASTVKASGDEEIEGTVSYDSSNDSAIFTPARDFMPDSEYCATLTTDIEDAYGNLLPQNVTWCFMTGNEGPAPTVASTSPADGAVDVLIDALVTAVFSVDMDPATITSETFIVEDSDGNPVAGTVTYDAASKTAKFTPSANLAYSSVYTVAVTTGVKDLSGIAMASDHVWSFTVVARDFNAWVDQGVVLNINPLSGYYPSAIYDAAGFGALHPPYAMWYSDGAGGVFVVRSVNGINWGAPTAMVGLTNAHHVQVLYDASCFGTVPCNAATPKYRIWFWDMGALPSPYDISNIATSDSVDGINWPPQTAATQNPAAKLVLDPDPGVGWNRGTYGPLNLFYQPGAPNTGSEPWDYRYVMYYDGTDGSHEDTGLAYSTDGLYWSAYTGNPVLSGSGIGGSAAWDCASAVYGTVYMDAAGFHYFYSGRGQDDGFGGCAFPPSFVGIGYAFSTDGKTWVRSASNPIFQISDGVAYRNVRTYTPSVIDDGTGSLKMYFSAVGALGPGKVIGLAILP